jgi:hypothetical protein
VSGGGEVRVVNNHLIKLSCVGSELLPRRRLCPEEEAVQVVNNKLIKLQCARSELLQRRKLCLVGERCGWLTIC